MRVANCSETGHVITTSYVAPGKTQYNYHFINNRIPSHFMLQKSNDENNERKEQTRKYDLFSIR